MILYNLLTLSINVLKTILSPFTMASNYFGNIFVDSKLTTFLRYLTFFLTKPFIVYLVTTLIFWASLFVVRPLFNFVRNRG